MTEPGGDFPWAEIEAFDRQEATEACQKGRSAKAEQYERLTLAMCGARPPEVIEPKKAAVLVDTLQVLLAMQVGKVRRLKRKNEELKQKAAAATAEGPPPPAAAAADVAPPAPSNNGLVVANEDKIIEGLQKKIEELKLEIADLHQNQEGLQQIVDGKLAGSPQFQNMKTLLKNKNEMLRELRTRLEKYENSDG